MKTIAQQLNVKKFPFKIKDSKGNEIYYETSNGYWDKREFDSQKNQIYFENSAGTWSKREFDAQGNEIYFEDSNGVIFDNRPKTVILSMSEIAKKFNIPVDQLQIKK
jgi:hypothetical protein